MDRNRLLELAIEGLEKQKEAVDEEIAAIRAELKGTGTARPAKSVATARMYSRTPAQRKAHSDRMRKYWAARREQAGAVKKAASPKTKPRRAAVNKAISVAMKAAWARRKAKAAGKDVKAKPGKVSPKS